MTKIKTVLITILFVLIFIIAFAGASYVMAAKECKYKNKEFFTEKNELDVMFFGSSHAENFFDPMALWRDYGITSYNFGNPEEPIPVTYWMMENAIHYNRPKIIVMDVFMINNTNPDKSMSGCIHYGLDAFPLNSKKIQAINDLCVDTNDKLDKLFTISTYHSRWQNIGDDHKNDIDFFVKGSLSYGHPYTMNVEPFENNEITDEISDIDDTNRDIIYLNKVIELCENNGIKLVFTSTPYKTTNKRQMDVNFVEKMAEKKGIPFVNYNKMPSIVNMQIDMYNIEHVNPSGLSKVTDYIGNYLSEKYQLEDHRGEIKYSDWQRYYDDFYLPLKYESMWSVDSFESLLMLLHDGEIKSKVIMIDDLSTNDEINLLLENVSRKCEIINSDFEAYTEDFQAMGIDVNAMNEENLAAVVIVFDSVSNPVLVKCFEKNSDSFICNNIYVKIEPKYIFKE